MYRHGHDFIFHVSELTSESCLLLKLCELLLSSVLMSFYHSIIKHSHVESDVNLGLRTLNN